jgi:hypothetical protein
MLSASNDKFQSRFYVYFGIAIAALPPHQTLAHPALPLGNHDFHGDQLLELKLMVGQQCCTGRLGNGLRVTMYSVNMCDSFTMGEGRRDVKGVSLDDRVSKRSVIRP